jgi:predicted Rossmann-fold nucleotide-binding protein
MKLKQAFNTTAMAMMMMFIACTSNTNKTNKVTQNDCIKTPNDSAVICLSCPSSDSVFKYIGTYMGKEDSIRFKYLAQDIYCADLFKKNNYPRGFVTIYGGSKITEDTKDCDESIKLANKKLYQDVEKFALDWTERFGNKYPILTGGGPGLMEAGNKGAYLAKGPSIGYTTYYDNFTDCSATKPYGGDYKKAFNPYVKTGLVFSSIVTREDALIKHSAAIILAPGGTGTEWEIFQILETTKSCQLFKRPIYLVGPKDIYWNSFDARLKDLEKHGTLNYSNVKQYFEFVEKPQDLVDKLRNDLKLNSARP